MPISRNRAPPPPEDLSYQTPPPPPLDSYTFTEPVRKLITQKDLDLFAASPTHSLLLTFITDLNTSVLNKPNSHPCTISPAVQSILSIFEHISATIDEFPAEDTGSRFGNHSFQKFYDAVWDRAMGWHEALNLPQGGVLEAGRYFVEMWGNRTRIDYGSGHELNWIAWLLVLRQLGVVKEEDYTALVLKVFTKYLAIMRRLQTTYYLEPAGSHGVWGLDDYHFLPFLFGSAQLYSHPHLRPKCIHSPEMLEEFAGEYIYLSAIAFINSIKTTAGLRWHSPMLDDISAAKNWGKINEGMKEMFKKEVLGKVPVMQHFMCGGVLAAPEGVGEGGREGEDREGLKHVHATWGECCGIKVPASVAARREEEGQRLRSVGRLPFD